VLSAVTRNNRDVGGSVFEMNGTGYLIKGLGYIQDIEDVKNIPLGTYRSIPVTLREIATVQMGGEPRLGITEENGEGEVVGGIVVMRYGENAQEVISRVKVRMKEVEKGLPPGVSIKVAYDRSDLINGAIGTVKEAISEEIIVVSIVVLIFLFHAGSGLVAIINIPLSILIGFMLMKLFGVSSNLMSLGGVALAVGDLVDSGIVMAENAYRQLTNQVLDIDDQKLEY
jgi:Cu/Ag efflux pump CusA